MIRHVTRFTEEIFALIIALVYLYEPFKKLYKVKHLISNLSSLLYFSLSIDIPIQSSTI
jgi:hypothetical protein